MIPLAPESTGRVKQKQPTKTRPWEQEEQGSSKLAKLGPGNQKRGVLLVPEEEPSITGGFFPTRQSFFPPHKEKNLFNS